jgi:hypothetical protein
VHHGVREMRSTPNEGERLEMTLSRRPDPESYDRRLEWLGAWSGIAWLIICGGGFGASGLLPVWSPATKPSELAAHLSDIKYQVLIGMLLVLVGGLTFLLTWSLTLAYQIRKYANSSPLAAGFLVLAGITGALIGMLCGVLGSAMAFRVDTIAPDTTQLLYDLIWFLFLIPWPPFMLWQFLTGFAILSDANKQTMFPRWTGYFSLWAGALEVFSALSVFFYRGPFSYNGLVTFWVPGVSFFGWVLVLAIVQVRRLPLARAALAGESSTDQTPNVDAEVEPIRIPSAAGI